MTKMLLFFFVMAAGLDPAIHVFVPVATKTWMLATSAGMTALAV